MSAPPPPPSPSPPTATPSASLPRRPYRPRITFPTRQLKLREWLTVQKIRYLDEVAQGWGEKWTLVVGNDVPGDIDAATAPIAYAYLAFYDGIRSARSPAASALASSGGASDLRSPVLDTSFPVIVSAIAPNPDSASDLDPPRIIPLILMNHQHCQYWPELDYVFRHSGISSPRHAVVWQNEFDHLSPDTQEGGWHWPTRKFLFVGLRAIPERLKGMEIEVVGVIDRLALSDSLSEFLDRKGSTSKILRPLIIVPGPACCSTLIALYFKLSSSWLPAVAWFLLCGLCAATKGLIPHHLAHVLDVQAGRLLLDKGNFLDEHFDPWHLLTIKPWKVKAVKCLTATILECRDSAIGAGGLLKGRLLTNKELVKRYHHVHSFETETVNGRQTKFSFLIACVPGPLKRWIYTNPSLIANFLLFKNLTALCIVSPYTRSAAKYIPPVEASKRTRVKKKAQQFWMFNLAQPKPIIDALIHNVEICELGLIPYENWRQKLSLVGPDRLGGVDAESCRAYKQTLRPEMGIREMVPMFEEAFKAAFELGLDYHQSASPRLNAPATGSSLGDELRRPLVFSRPMIFESPLSMEEEESENVPR